ncbi:hypothetical protein ACROYT_G036272 [Oculina patagonica]
MWLQTRQARQLKTESRIIQIFGNSHQVQVCGHRLDRKDNEKLNVRIIKVGILVVDYVDNFCYSDNLWRQSPGSSLLLRKSLETVTKCKTDAQEKDRGCPPNCYEGFLHGSPGWLSISTCSAISGYICERLGYWMLTMQGKNSKNDEFGGKGNITAAFFWVGSSVHGQRIQ